MVLGNHPEALSLAVDAQGIDRLRHAARNDPRAAIRETARQFEALLMNSLLKTMRETTSQDGLFDNEQTRLYMSLLDQQLSQTMSRRGIGLAEVLERQLTKGAGTGQAGPLETVAGPKGGIGAAVAQEQRPTKAAGTGAPGPWESMSGAAPVAGPWNAAAASAVPVLRAPSPAASSIMPPAAPRTEPAAQKPQVVADSSDPSPGSHAHRFIERVLSHAREASEQTGLPARFLVGHAALESGWGRYEIRHEDGSPSHNLFGIKADRSWRGDVAEVMTTEYENGVPVQRIERFRAYESYDHAFRDYAAFLRDNPRYAQVFGATHSARAFAEELQSAGYATDPRYADKLAAVIDGPRLRRTIIA